MFAPAITVNLGLTWGGCKHTCLGPTLIAIPFPAELWCLGQAGEGRQPTTKDPQRRLYNSEQLVELLHQPVEQTARVRARQALRHAR